MMALRQVHPNPSDFEQMLKDEMNKMQGSFQKKIRHLKEENEMTCT